MIAALFLTQTTNLLYLLKQLKTQLGKGIDEIHLWDFSTTFGSRKCMIDNSNLRKTTSDGSGTYVPIQISHEKIIIQVKASSDAHFLLSNQTEQYEIVLGGWDNTESVIRHNKKTELFNRIKGRFLDSSKFKTFTISIHNNVLSVCGETEIISYKLPKPFIIEEVYLKTGFGSKGEFIYEPINNNGVFYMDKCDINDFFSYYKEDVLYLDDTISFLDMDKFSYFIQSISTYQIVLPNTMNTIVFNYFMKTYKIMPDLSKDFMYDYFINKKESLLIDNYTVEPLVTFYDLHCFVCNAKTWQKIATTNGTLEMRVKNINPMIGISNFIIANKINNETHLIQPSHPNLHYITLATKPHPVLDLLQKTVKSKGEEITVLGLNENREIGQDLPNGKRRLGIKIKYLYDYLMQDLLDENDIVLFSDAYDVCYVGDQPTILKRFKKMNKPVVFGAELGCYPDGSKASQYPPSPNGFRFLNSGLFIGYVYALRDCLKDYVFDDEENDQLWWTNTFLKRQDIIELDYHNQLFLNCAFLNPAEIKRNGDTFIFHGKTPQLIHGNGPSKPCIEPIIEYFVKKYIL